MKEQLQAALPGIILKLSPSSFLFDRPALSELRSKFVFFQLSLDIFSYQWAVGWEMSACVD